MVLFFSDDSIWLFWTPAHSPVTVLPYEAATTYHISSNRNPRLLLEPPGSLMNITLFKTARFLVSYLLLQSETTGRPYRRSAIQAIRTNDAVHHSATGNVQSAL